jgi:hypothetical protein
VRDLLQLVRDRLRAAARCQRTSCLLVRVGHTGCDAATHLDRVAFTLSVTIPDLSPVAGFFVSARWWDQEEVFAAKSNYAMRMNHD